MKKIGSLCISFLCLLWGTACTPVDLLNATIPKEGYTLIKDISYGDADRQKLDIYVPDAPAPHHPVIVFYYGGSWQEGSKDDYLFAGQALASKGYITVIADYRLYPEVYFPAFMDDVAKAFVWTHEHIAQYDGNKDEIFVAGHSAGAYNAVMLTLNCEYIEKAGGEADWIAGTIGISGPYDFLPFTDPKIIDLFSRQEDTLTQPITFARSGLKPMLLMTGDDDDQVLARNSLRLNQTLSALGDPVKLIVYPGLGHVGIALALARGFREKAPVLNDIDAFISSVVDTGTF